MLSLFQKKMHHDDHYDRNTTRKFLPKAKVCFSLVADHFPKRAKKIKKFQNFLLRFGNRFQFYLWRFPFKISGKSKRELLLLKGLKFVSSSCALLLYFWDWTNWSDDHHAVTMLNSQTIPQQGVTFLPRVPARRGIFIQKHHSTIVQPLVGGIIWGYYLRVVQNKIWKKWKLTRKRLKSTIHPNF